MNRRLIKIIDPLKPVIKACWELLLRSEPPVNPMGNPDTMIFKMDETLGSLATSLAARTIQADILKDPSVFRSFKSTCPCAKNPLIAYHTCGESALLAVLGKELASRDDLSHEAQEEMLTHVRLTYHYLAQTEIKHFCDLCLSACPKAKFDLATRRRICKRGACCTLG